MAHVWRIWAMRREFDIPELEILLTVKMLSKVEVLVNFCG